MCAPVWPGETPQGSTCGQQGHPSALRGPRLYILHPISRSGEQSAHRVSGLLSSGSKTSGHSPIAALASVGQTG